MIGAIQLLRSHQGEGGLLNYEQGEGGLQVENARKEVSGRQLVIVILIIVFESAF